MHSTNHTSSHAGCACTRNPLHCIIPPYMVEHMLTSADARVRARAAMSLASDAAFRTGRAMTQSFPSLMATAAPVPSKQRLVYSAGGTDALPGALARSEGEGPVADDAVNEAYDGSGDTYDFYETLFHRTSLDDRGMRLLSSVHVGDIDPQTGEFVPMNNAFWNGEQMAYGDGDGVVFRRFTRSLDVIAHELTHGVQSFTSNLRYSDESGALNEHFADVFGILVRQWKRGESAATANWLVGADVLVQAPTRRAIRDMESPGTAFQNDPYIGTDPQPAHYSRKYVGPRDRGGVHINSGIPNRAFVLAAKKIGGNAWDVTGRIWFETLLQLSGTSVFKDCARISIQVASGSQYGLPAKRAVEAAWKAVGVI